MSSGVSDTRWICTATCKNGHETFAKVLYDKEFCDVYNAKSKGACVKCGAKLTEMRREFEVSK